MAAKAGYVKRDEFVRLEMSSSGNDRPSRGASRPRITIKSPRADEFSATPATIVRRSQRLSAIFDQVPAGPFSGFTRRAERPHINLRNPAEGLAAIEVAVRRDVVTRYRDGGACGVAISGVQEPHHGIKVAAVEGARASRFHDSYTAWGASLYIRPESLERSVTVTLVRRKDWEADFSVNAFRFARAALEGIPTKSLKGRR